MVTIADLIPNAVAGDGACDLVVSPDTSVRDALARMNELGCSRIGIESDSFGFRAVLTREDLLSGLIHELDKAQIAIGDLQRHIDGRLSEQLQLVQASLRSIAETDKGKLDIAVMNLTEGLIILDKSAMVESANPAARSLLGLPDSAVLTDISDALSRLGVCGLLTCHVSPDSEGGRLQVQSAHHRVLRIRWTPIRDSWDRFEGFVVLIRDITDEIAADNAKNEFLAAMSHELRTPLTSLRNSISNMLAGVVGKFPSKALQYLTAMDGDCLRLTGLVNDLIDVARLEADNLPICRRVVNLVDLISDTLNRCADRARAHKVHLSFRMHQYVPPIMADPERIRQVLVNLIDNALHFTPAFGKITIRCWDESDTVCFSVEDTGPGIPPEFQSVLFYKFTQLARQSGPGYHGSGLGLAVCKGILAAHGGSIRLQSHPGSGSTFVVSLPCTKPDILIAKHLENLAPRCADANEALGLIVVRCMADSAVTDVSYDPKTVLTGILTESQSVLTHPDDLAVQSGPDELIFVACRSSDNPLHVLRHKIEKILTNSLRINLGRPAFVPMVGMSVYPADVCPVRDLDSLARKRIRTIQGVLPRAKAQ